MDQNLSENNKFYGFGKALLMIGTLVTFVCGAFLLGVYKYEPTLMVASGMIILFIGLVILLLGLLMVNVKDECFFKASGWVYMSFGLVLFLLTIVRLSVIFEATSEVGFTLLLTPGFVLQVLAIALSFILNLVGVFLIFRGITKILQDSGKEEASELIRSRWRMLRISGVFFLVMKIISVISEPLWQEAMAKAKQLTGGDMSYAVGLTEEPFDISFFTNLSTVSGILTIIAAVWLAVSFLRIFIPVVKSWKD
ncbi:MAG: hypothetical protein IK054_03730 [Lachnospiraceae bacterium]|nr:hypothetical protein [Lachnospiraceae bacterium]